MPGATVTLRNLETGIARTTITDEQGRYHAPNLALGNYEVQAALAGFQTAVRRGVELTVGRHAIVDFTLKVGEMTEEIVVTGEAPLVDTTSSTISGLVEDKQMRELPLNLRSYEQLAALQPGVVAGSPGRVGVRGGSGTQLYISGARSEFNTFQIDNVDVNDLWGKTPGGMSGGVLGVESVKEFSVLTSNYSAEFSKVAGGVVNVITRSGTNQLDGSVYWFHRNDNLDARNFFDGEKPEFRRNQFGAAVGGPVIKDRTFFFANYEGLREDRPRTVRAVVPTALARQGILPNRTVAVSPRVVPYLNLYPLPNGPEHGDGTADLIQPSTVASVTDYLLLRFDHQFSTKQSLAGRYIFEDGNQATPSVALPQQTRLLEGKKQNLTVQHQSIFSSRLINEFRFGFNRTVQNDFDKIVGLPESLNFIPLPGRVLGTLQISDLSTIGHSGSQPLFFTFNNFQYIDNVTYTRGRHGLRLGADIRRTQLNAMNVAALHGVYRFDRLEDFLRGGPARDFRFLLPGAGRDAPFYIRQWTSGFYVQDDYKARSNLTLNLGLRYEFITVPTERFGKVANLRSPSDPRPTIGDPLFINPSKKNFAPRVGFAWDPGGSGKTSIRGGFGIFFDQLGSAYLQNTMFRVPPFFVRVSVRNAVFPDQYQRSVGDADLDKIDVFELGELFEVNSLDFQPSNPYMLNYNLAVQRELFADTIFSIAYVGSRGIHLGRVVDTNTPAPERLSNGRWFYPANAPRRNPNFANFAIRTFDANSFYNSLQLSVRRRFSGGLLYQGSYTWSHSTDDASGISAGGDGFHSANTHSLVAEDRKFMRGNSDFDVRHNFAFSFVYELPFGRGKPFGGSLAGLPDKLLSGWQLSGLISVASGSHASVFVTPNISRSLSGSFFGERPDLVPGASNNPIDPGNPERYLDSASFMPPPLGMHGNLGRGTVTPPGLATLDISLTKSTNVTEGVRVQFRAEIFNAFNRANFGTPDLDVVIGSATRPTINPRFGRITSTRTSAREIQLGLKILF